MQSTEPRTALLNEVNKRAGMVKGGAAGFAANSGEWAMPYFWLGGSLSVLPALLRLVAKACKIVSS